MEKQISQLELETEKIGIQMSKRPPKFYGATKDKEIFKDEYIFKTLFTGLQWAGVLHANAFKNSVTNSRIRGIFLSFLYDELDLITNAVRYGKIKGWVPTPPLYEY